MWKNMELLKYLQKEVEFMNQNGYRIFTLYL